MPRRVKLLSRNRERGVTEMRVWGQGWSWDSAVEKKDNSYLSWERPHLLISLIILAQGHMRVMSKKQHPPHTEMT